MLDQLSVKWQTASKNLMFNPLDSSAFSPEKKILISRIYEEVVQHLMPANLRSFSWVGSSLTPFDSGSETAVTWRKFLFLFFTSFIFKAAPCSFKGPRGMTKIIFTIRSLVAGRITPCHWHSAPTRPGIALHDFLCLPGTLSGELACPVWERHQVMDLYQASRGHCANGRGAVLSISQWIYCMYIKMFIKVWGKQQWCFNKWVCHVPLILHILVSINMNNKPAPLKFDQTAWTSERSLVAVFPKSKNVLIKTARGARSPKNEQEYHLSTSNCLHNLIFLHHSWNISGKYDFLPCCLCS